MSETTGERAGGCACGAVRFRIKAPIRGMAACYCRSFEKMPPPRR